MNDYAWKHVQTHHSLYLPPHVPLPTPFGSNSTSGCYISGSYLCISFKIHKHNTRQHPAPTPAWTLAIELARSYSRSGRRDVLLWPVASLLLLLERSPIRVIQCRSRAPSQVRVDMHLSDGLAARECLRESPRSADKRRDWHGHARSRRKVVAHDSGLTRGLAQEVCLCLGSKSCI